MSTQSLSTTWLADKSLTSDFQTGGFDFSNWDGAQIAAIFDFSGGATSAGDIKLQTSVDNTNWTDYTGSSKAVTNASTVESWGLTSIQEQYIRVHWNNTAGTGGTVTIKLGLFKRYANV